MTADPLAQVIESAVLDCGNASCDVCNLGRLPGEMRPDWLARLKARFASDPPIAGAPLGRPSAESLLVDCDRCGEPRWVGRACQECRIATRFGTGETA